MALTEIDRELDKKKIRENVLFGEVSEAAGGEGRKESDRVGGEKREVRRKLE